MDEQQFNRVSSLLRELVTLQLERIQCDDCGYDFRIDSIKKEILSENNFTEKEMTFLTSLFEL